MVAGPWLRTVLSSPELEKLLAPETESSGPSGHTFRRAHVS